MSAGDRVHPASPAPINKRLLVCCKAALGAFERNDAIDWNELADAIKDAEAPADGAGTAGPPPTVLTTDWFREIERALFGKADNTFTPRQIHALNAVIARIMAEGRSLAQDQEFHEPPDGGRIVRIYRNGSWLEDSPTGQRKHYSWPDESEGRSLAPGWRPIETCPQDVDFVIGAWRCAGAASGFDIGEVVREDSGGDWSNFYGKCQPTHWMPLPDPPVPARSEEK